MRSRDGKLRTSDESAGWARWAGLIQRRPAAFAAVAAGVLVLLAIPFLSMRLGSADSGSDPAGTTTRKAYDLLAKGFGSGYNGPLQLVAQVSGPAEEAAFARVERAVASAPGVVGSTRPVFIPSRAPGLPGVALADVYPKGSPQDASTSNLLHAVRDQVVPDAERGTGVARARRRPDGDLRRLRHRPRRASCRCSSRSSIGLSFLLLMCVFRAS